MKARDLMHRITLISGSATVREAAELMRAKDIGSVLIGSESKIEGILTERDLVKVVASRVDPDKARVSSVMTPHPVEIDADASVEEVSEVFRKHHFRRLPVHERGKIVGIISVRDVAKAIPYLFFQRNRNEKFAGENQY